MAKAGRKLAPPLTAADLDEAVGRERRGPRDGETPPNADPSGQSQPPPLPEDPKSAKSSAEETASDGTGEYNVDEGWSVDTPAVEPILPPLPSHLRSKLASDFELDVAATETGDPDEELPVDTGDEVSVAPLETPALGSPIVRRKHPVLVRLLVVLLILGVGGIWAAWRSSPKLESEVRQRMERMGERLGGTFAYDAMGPAGLTGIEIEGLRFTPDPEASIAGIPLTQAFEVETVRVFPDLWSLLGRRIRLGDAEVVGMRFRAGPDLEAILDRSSTSTLAGPDSVGGASSGRGCARLAELPRRVRLERGRILLGSLRGRPLPELALRRVDVELGCEDQQIRANVEGRITVGNLAPDRAEADLVASLGGVEGHQLDVRFDEPFAFSRYLPLDAAPGGLLGPDTSLTAEGFHVTPRSVTLNGLAVSGLTLDVPRADGWQVSGIDADALLVEIARGGPALTLIDAVAHLDQFDEGGAAPRVHDIGVRRLEAWTDGALENHGALVLLGRPGDERSGTLQLSLSESDYGRGRVLSLRAEDYPVEELTPLLDGGPLALESGRLNGSIALSASPGEPIWAVIDARLHRGVVNAPQLAARPMRAVDMAFEGEVVVARDFRELIWEHSELRLAGVPFATDGRVARNEDGPHIELSVDADDIDAAALHNALPRGLVPAAEGIRAAGRIDASLRLDLDVTRPDDAVVDLDLDMSRARVAASSAELPVDLLAGDFSLRIETNDGHERVIGPTTPSWTALDEAGPYLVAAVTSAEDGRFWRHNGFDWRAIQSSIRENLRQRRFARGGSTISQQVARSLFLVREPTLGRKLEEAFITWQLESALTKERIMELYINVVHWGPDVYGIREASATYFGRDPADLTIAESAFLASILSNPIRFGRQYARDELAEHRVEKMCNVLTNMAHIRAITRAEAAATCAAIEAGRISDAPRPVHLIPDEDLAVAPAARL